VDQTTLEFAVLKLQGLYSQQLERLAVFPDSNDPFLATLQADLHGRMEEALTRMMDKPYFYWVSQNRIELATPARVRSIANFLKTNMVLLNARGSASFQQLIRTLPTEHIITFAEQFKNDPTLQLRILQSLESSQLNSVADKEVSRVYLRLVCQLEPRRVTSVLRTNNRLDINEKLQICQESRCLRGEAYCLKKISNFDESQRIYERLLKKFFGFSRFDLSEPEKSEVLELANEILEDLWEEEARKTLRQLVVFICDHSRGVRQTSDLLRPLLARLFNYDVLELLADFKKLSHWPSMMASRALFEQLSANYRTIDYINFNIKAIIETQNAQDKTQLRETSRRGAALVMQGCIVCGKFKNELASEIRYHTCTVPVHDSCQIEIKSFSCRACSFKNLGRLTRCLR
jgi:DNA integrity scanning protein DisA with diadenylate cyclase activity